MTAHYHETTIDEMGGMMSVSMDVELECDLWPAEPRTWDYPGSEGYIEITSIVVRRIHGDGYSVDLDDRPDWRAIADEVAQKWVEENDERLCEEIAEDLKCQEEAALESMYEARAELKRERAGE